MEKYGLLLGQHYCGCMLHCTPKFSSARMLIIPWVWLILCRLFFPFTGLVALVSVSNVLGGCEETCGVIYHFYMDRTFGIHTCLYNVLVSYKRDTTYGISQYPSGFADLCFGTGGMRPVYMNLSNRNSSVLRERMSQPVLYSTHPTESASLVVYTSYYNLQCTASIHWNWRVIQK